MSPSLSLRHAKRGKEISGTEILRFGQKRKALYKTLNWQMDETDDKGAVG